MSKPTPELLAPAGDFDALRAAVANGANAVYFGLDQFNARHRAANFTLEQLPEVVDYLHHHNVKGFVTFNTLIFSDELPAAADYLKAIAAAGADAVIVQDLGIAALVHELCPSLAIHGSTQMTLTESSGIEFVRALGVERVVLARELSLADIGTIAGQTAMPLEVFVHGALCVSYSGQCLTSESLGGRSANRGQCAQACRLPYELLVDGQVKDLGDKAYLLSPSDLAAYDLIGDLTKLGVCSFKIEGRLKSAHYVAATCQTYRAAIDAARHQAAATDAAGAGAKGAGASGGQAFHISPSQKLDLEQTFSRGFIHGFLDGVNHQQLVAARFPKARGTRIGTVHSKTDHSIIIELTTDHRPLATDLKAGDGVVFDEGHPEQDEQGGRIFAVRHLNHLTATRPHQARAAFSAKSSPPSPTPRAARPSSTAKTSHHQIELEFREGDVNLAYINPGAIVWKTDDPAIKRRLAHSFSREIVVHRTPIEFILQAFVGKYLTLTARAGDIEATATWDEKTLEAASKFPITEAVAREQLSRLGDTPLELARLILETDGRAMVPKSILNDLRRQVCQELLARRAPHREIIQRDVLAEHRTAAAALQSHVLTTAESINGPSRAVDRSQPAVSQVAGPQVAGAKETPALYVLARTMEQVEAALAHRAANSGMPLAMLYVEFEDVRRYGEAVRLCRDANVPVALASIRIVKPNEQGFLKQVSDCNPDALLVRSLAALGYYREKAPHLPLIADYALNIANELTAALLARRRVIRMVPSYDLNWSQLAAMLGRFDPAWFECVIHQHMPMFHMEHCVFAHTLSNGKDFHDCGRPCERHRVDLRDRVGEAHPLIPDVGCRNTVFNAQAQTAAEYLPEMQRLGIRHFRVELLRENAAETTRILDRYTRLLSGKEKPAETLRSLRVLNQLGVTRGTLAHE